MHFSVHFVRNGGGVKWLWSFYTYLIQIVTNYSDQIITRLITRFVHLRIFFLRHTNDIDNYGRNLNNGYWGYTRQTRMHFRGRVVSERLGVGVHFNSWNNCLIVLYNAYFYQ